MGIKLGFLAATKKIFSRRQKMKTLCTKHIFLSKFLGGNQSFFHSPSVNTGSQGDVLGWGGGARVGLEKNEGKSYMRWAPHQPTSSPRCRQWRSPCLSHRGTGGTPHLSRWRKYPHVIDQLLLKGNKTISSDCGFCFWRAIYKNIDTCTRVVDFPDYLVIIT